MAPRDERALRRRPPVQVATLVRSDIDHTFDVFVRRIGEWWPVETFSAGRERVRAVELEPVVGGRLVETWDDGTTVAWGEVVALEPPSRLTITWDNTPVPTEVELTFRSLGPNLTRVSVEHRGWEALTDEQLAEDCALPGGYTAGAYATGWTRILERLTALAEAPDQEVPCTSS